MTAQDLARAMYRHDEAYASADAFLAAYERGDAAACAAFYTEDATVLPGDRPVAIGRAEIEALFAGIFKQGAKKLSLIPGEVSCDGDLAYEIGTAILEIPQSDGSLLFDERRYLTVLKRQSDGSWRMQASAWRGARGD
jgi:uncharacterized protein (TIGR02246 family)